jgi:hypothetical protein
LNHQAELLEQQSSTASLSGLKKSWTPSFMRYDVVV